MKILQVLPDPTEMFACRWTEAFLQKGWGVDTVYHASSKDAPNRARQLDIPLRGRTKILNPLRRRILAIQFARIVQELNPDIVLFHQIPWIWLQGVFPLHRPTAVLVFGSDIFFETGRMHKRRMRQRTRWVRRFVRKSRALLITTNSYARDYLINEYGADPNNVVIQNWGIDLKVFYPPASSMARDKIILSPRSCAPYYRQKQIVEAFAHCLSTYPDSRLVIIGGYLNESYCELVERRAEELNISENVVIIRRLLSPEEMGEWYRRSTVSVSIPPSDQGGFTLWEAAACGCPIIASDYPTMRAPPMDCLDLTLVADISPQVLSEAMTRFLKGAPRTVHDPDGMAFITQHMDAPTNEERIVRLVGDIARGTQYPVSKPSSLHPRSNGP